MTPRVTPTADPNVRQIEWTETVTRHATQRRCPCGEWFGIESLKDRYCSTRCGQAAQRSSALAHYHRQKRLEGA